jgi:hypothetical protein
LQPFGDLWNGADYGLYCEIKLFKELIDMRNFSSIGQWPMGLVCDTPVPYYEVGVSCGLPGEMGELPPEMVLLPSMLTRGRQVFIVNAEGDSMTGVGIYSGDALLIESTQRVHCGEVVMVSIDGEELLKVYYVDDCGRHWLLPANDKYQPCELTADMKRSAMRLQLPAGFKHPCSIGTVQRTISNHRYMEKHIDNWAANGALNRELKLMEQLRMLLQD